MRLEVFRVSYLSSASARGKILSSAVHKLSNWDETDFTNQCKASFKFGFILSSIFCLMRNQRSLYASSSLKHAMTGLLWGAKASFSRIITNLAAAENTHDSGNIKTLTHNALDFITTPWQAQCHQKNTAYADALTTRLCLSQKCLRHTPGKPNRFDIICCLTEFSEAPKIGVGLTEIVAISSATCTAKLCLRSSIYVRCNSWSRQICLEVRRAEMQCSFVSI